MPKDDQRVRIDRNWQPPEGFDPGKTFKKKCAFRHISKVDAPEGSLQDRVHLHINQPLTEAEKTRFTNLLHGKHGSDWYGCACWSGANGGLTVRISFRRSANLTHARMDVGKEVDIVLDEIFSERCKTKK